MLVIYIKYAEMLKYTNIQLLSYGSGTKAFIVHKQDEFTLQKRSVIRNGLLWVLGNLGEGVRKEEAHRKERAASQPCNLRPPPIVSLSL